MTKLQRFNNLFRHLKLIFHHNRILINYQSIPVWTLTSRMLLFSSLYNSRTIMRSRNSWICNKLGCSSRSRIFKCSRMTIFGSRLLLRHWRCYKSILHKYLILVVVVSMMTLVLYMIMLYELNQYHMRVTCKPLHWLNLLYNIKMYNNQLLKLDLVVHSSSNNLLLFNNSLLLLSTRNP